MFKLTVEPKVNVQHPALDSDRPLFTGALPLGSVTHPFVYSF